MTKLGLKILQMAKVENGFFEVIPQIDTAPPGYLFSTALY